MHPLTKTIVIEAKMDTSGKKKNVYVWTLLNDNGSVWNAGAMR